MLWLWIMGLTDHLIQGHICSDDYEKDAEKVHHEVSRLNSGARDRQRYYLQLTGKSTQDVDISTSREPIGSISINTVANFFLLKSWSLFESMKYSESIIPKVKN